MTYSSVNIVRDGQQNPIPQYYSTTNNDFEALSGENGASYGVGIGRNAPISTQQFTYTAGISNPSSALVLAETAVAGSALQATTYNVAIDFTTAMGRTTLGTSQSSLSVDTAGKNITTSVVLPIGADGVGVYVWATGTATLLGTISSSGSITYSGGAVAGLSVTVSGSTLNITISAPSSVSGGSPLATNTTYVQAGTAEIITVPLPATFQKDAKYLVSVSNPASLASPFSVTFLNGIKFGATTPTYATVDTVNVPTGTTQSFVVEGWLLGDTSAQIQLTNTASLGTNSGTVRVDIRSI